MNKNFLPTFILSFFTLASFNITQAQNVWRVSGKAEAGLAELDSFMHVYMQTYDLKGGQIAVARQGKVIYARGYTWGPVSDLKVEPTHQFRLASLTKVITGIMVHKVCDSFHVSLDTKVNDILKLSGNGGRPLRKSEKPANNMHTPGYYFADVTIRQLLEHRGGWDRDANSANDPTYGHDKEIAAYFNHPLPVTKQEIAYWGATREMQWYPGYAKHYSNYGYLLLGLVIEKLTGTDYITAVKRTLMLPFNVKRPILSATERKYKTMMETEYTVIPKWEVPCATGPGTCLVQYGGENNKNFDSFGGWAMAAVDYVKLISEFSYRHKPMPYLDVDKLLTWFLNAKADPDANSYEHGGSLPGTASYMIHRGTMVDFTVVWNTTNNTTKQFVWKGKAYAIDQHATVWNKILSDITDWPTEDLSPQFFQPGRY